MDNEQLVERLIKCETELESVRRQCNGCLGRTLPELEQRLRAVETKIAYWCGGLALLQVALTIAAKFIK